MDYIADIAVECFMTLGYGGGIRTVKQAEDVFNRVVTNHISNLHFCPTQTSVDNLLKEGITPGVHLVGDTMVNALAFNKEIAKERSQILKRLGLAPKQYLVLTIHRSSNTDSREHMENIIGAIGEAGLPVVFPVHPRTKKFLETYGIWNRLPANIIVSEPLGYLDMLKLMKHALKILTDSGGIQKEAYMPGVPYITLRDITEWVEKGWDVLVGANIQDILLNSKLRGCEKITYIF